MVSNPYLVASTRQARARSRVVGWWAGFADWAVVGAVVVAFPFLLGSVFRPLTVNPAAAPTHTADLVTRLALVLAAAMSLNSYSLLVRGPDRGVLDLHPLLPGPWYAARMRQLAVEQLPWLVASLLFLIPGAQLGVPLVPSAVALAGAWAAGIGVGVGVNLGAPAAALSPAWAPYLDVLRGHNPRMQAALIWAPGVALGISGTASLLSTLGLEAALTGGGPVTVLLGVPWAVAAVGLWAGRRQAATIERVPALLGEIDAQWAAVETPEDARHVGWDWLVRFVPEGLRRDLLRELRHLGRTLKIWQSASWGLAIASAAAGWVPAQAGFGNLPAVMLGGVALVGLAALRMGATDPPWLEEVLDLPRGRVRLARALAVWLQMQPIILAGLVTGLVRNGGWVLEAGLRAEVVGVLLAGAGAWAGARWRVRGWLVYVPIAAVSWAAGGWW